jgi:hypothetical protein
VRRAGTFRHGRRHRQRDLTGKGCARGRGGPAAAPALANAVAERACASVGPTAEARERDGDAVDLLTSSTLSLVMDRVADARLPR